MKTTMKILPLMLGIMLFFTQCEKDNTIQETILKDYSVFNCNGEQELWAGAGQNILANGVLVGKVEWGIDGTTLYVRYIIDKEGWSLTETHLWVGDDIDDIPGTAVPGQFPYKMDHNFVSLYEYEIDISGFTSGPLYLAAHADVAGDKTDYSSLVLPVDVDFSVVFFPNYANSDAYFETTIHDGPFAGIYEGWCLDSYTGIATSNPNLDRLVVLEGTIYSSYDENLPPLFFYQENLPLINWIINYDFVGKESQGGYGAYTLGDVQKAIWILLEEEPNPNPRGGVGPFNDDRVDQIVSMAEEFGEDYVPGCGEYFVIIVLVPNQQTTMFKYPVPCVGYDETAWALGGVEGTHDDYTFIENGISAKWGWFFDITCY